MNSASFYAILAVAMVTYLTRAAGPILMASVPVSPRLGGVLNALSTSLMAAIVFTSAFEGDWPLVLGVGVAATVMAVFRRPGWAMLAAVLATAGARQLVLMAS